MKTRYRFIGRRLNMLDQRWYFCWFATEHPEVVGDTYYVVAIDEFWRQP